MTGLVKLQDKGEEIRLSCGVNAQGTPRFSLIPEYVKQLYELPYSMGYHESKFGEIVYHRTYSRLKADGRQENWYDTVLRVINGIMTIRRWWNETHNLPWNEERAQDRAWSMATSMLRMTWLPPGRGLWLMGSDYLYERGSMGLFNCGYSDINVLDDDLAWLMDALMCGVGVGFSTTSKSQQLFSPDQFPVSVYIIPDTREGWVESLRLLLASYLGKNDAYQVFDVSLVRKAGMPIKGFGGTSSGPEPLTLLHDRVRLNCEAYIHKNIDWVHLIANLANCVGEAVVAGNVRRSSEIALGNPRDISFLDLKDYDQHPERLAWGRMSNNTCTFKTRDDFFAIPEISKRAKKNGEPGFYNLLNAQRYGRYGDTTYGEDSGDGLNPCGEVILEDKELCNLSEIFPSRCSTRKEFLQAVGHATFYSSTVALYPTHSPATNVVLAKNRRIGVSLSGVAEWTDQWTLTKCISWMKDGYHLVREKNEESNRKAGVPRSIRVTTVKPSGSISQLAGVTPGMHFSPYRFSIRRMIVSRDHPLVPILLAAGYVMEAQVDFVPPHEVNGKPRFEKYNSFSSGSNMVPVMSDKSVVFEIPLCNKNSRPQNEVSAWEQFALAATLQREWSDNGVSCTITFDPTTEGEQLEQMVAQFLPVLKAFSVLPQSNGNGETKYPQMPYEEITEEEYRHRIETLKPIEWDRFHGSDGEDEKYCTTDKCEIDFSKFERPRFVHPPLGAGHPALLRG